MSEPPAPNFDLVILIGPGVIIGLVAALIAYLKLRRRRGEDDKP